MELIKTLFGIVMICLSLGSCDTTGTRKNEGSDTLIIKSDAAVLYYPDSNGVETMKQELDIDKFNLAVDDYTFFMNNASRYLDSVKLKTTIVTGGRVVKFICQDKSEHIIDTKELVHFWGIILFNRYHRPKVIDMTIIDMEYNKYFR